MIRPTPRQFPLSNEATAIAIAADGKRMAAAAASAGRVHIYDLKVGRVLFRLGVTATALAFLPDGVRLVTAWSGPRRVAPSRPGNEVPSSAPPSAPSTPSTPSVPSFAMIPSSDIPSTESSREAGSNREGARDSSRDSTRDSNRDGTRSGDDEARRSIRVWDVVTGRCLTQEPWFGEAPIAVSPDGQWIAAAADRVTTAVLLLRVSNGNLERMLELPDAHPLRSLSFSHDGKYLVASTGVSPVVCWSLVDFAFKRLPILQTGDVAIAFSASGLVAVGDNASSVRVYSSETDDVFVKLSVRNGPRLLGGIDALSFSPDEALVVARGRKGTTQIFSRLLAQPLWTASPGPLAFLPDGKLIAAWWCGAIWMRDAESGDMVVNPPEDPPASEGSQDAPPSRKITLRSGEPDVPGLAAVRVAAPIAPVISDEVEPGLVEAAVALIARLSSRWSGTTYRQPPTVAAKDPDGLGVRLPLRAGLAYVNIRPRKDGSRLFVQVFVDEPDVDPPPSSSLVRLSRWIRDRFGAEARRQAAADREWVAELAPNAAEGEVRIERAPASLTIVLERPLLPSVDDIEALIYKAEQKLAS